jgi:serine/threonine protein kinase/tetratricopeptide (TPR) repeat protein
MLREIFLEAAEIQDPNAREAFLVKACGGDATLRRRLDELLAADQVAGPAPVTSSNSQLTQPLGSFIGRYKLLQQIGEGGCGVVYMAEQEEPVRRRVALKIIKLGMDTRSVIARFEAERQALALMDHPNIAKVLDAGSTDNGRPYFVMELVRGVKITDYCDEKALSTHRRLELFTQVCHATQHAHQKGIIHRDIKPSNVLVTVNDGVAVPKVIDFGIAKATTDQRLTDKTVFTAFEQFIGTPAYMSPEQAEITSVDVDTRSDIYSLGVLLYELLTGKTPFDATELLQAGLDEMRRTIREKEPARPSTRVSTLGADELTTTAKRRGLEPPKLAGVLRGDLDWIVMKCLEKDRARRYETANGLVMDIQRHLSNEPVVACPPSNFYRFQKTVRRNKRAFTAATVILVLLIGGVATSTLEAVRARRAEQDQIRLRQQAEDNEQKAHENQKQAQTEAAMKDQVLQFFDQMLQGVGPEVAKGRDATILKELLEKTTKRVGAELTNQPMVEAYLLESVGTVYTELGDYPTAERMQRRVVELRKKVYPNGHREVAEALDNLAITVMLRGELHQAEAFSREAVAVGKRSLGPEHSDNAAWLNNLATILKHEAKFQDAEAIYREALALNRKVLGNEHREVAATLNNLALVIAKQGKLEEAEQLLRESLEMCNKLFGNEHPLIAQSLTSLANLLQREGKLQEAEATGHKAVAMQTKLLGPEHPSVANALANLALVFEREGNLQEAETKQREALAIRRNALDAQHPILSQSLFELGLVLNKRGNLPEAESMLRESLAIANKLPNNDYVNQTNVLAALNKVLAAEGKPMEDKATIDAARVSNGIK